jgi:hypothetical protein
LCLESEDKKRQNAGQPGQRNKYGEVRTEYKKIKEIPMGRDFSHPFRSALGLLYKGYRFSFPEAKRPGVALTTHPHLAPRLKKE